MTTDAEINKFLTEHFDIGMVQAKRVMQQLRYGVLPGLKYAFDYFAAHAPIVRTTNRNGEPVDAPPDWFWADDPKKPKHPDTISHPTGEAKKKFDEEKADYLKERNLWETERFFAWRWYYAEQMMKTRPDLREKEVSE